MPTSHAGEGRRQPAPDSRFHPTDDDMDMGGYCGGELPSVNDLDIAAAAAEAAMEVLAPSSSEEDSDDDDDDEDDSSSSGSGAEDVDMVGFCS